ncbi:hypothetical protein ACHQM5_024690 [Ranunculus cassubicifolius]
MDYYDRILKELSKRISLLGERTPKVIKSHFGKIQVHVSNYIAILSEVEGTPHSGWNDDNYAKEAQAVFLATHKTPWKWQGCYEVLKNEAKFHNWDLNNDKLQRARRGENVNQMDFADGTQIPVDLNNVGEAPPRALGKKAEMARRK